MGCWGAAEEECQKSASGRGSTEVLNQHKNVGPVGTVFITIVSWLGDVFQVLGCLLVTPVTLDKSFFVLSKFHFSLCVGRSACQVLCVQCSSPVSVGTVQRGMVGYPVAGGGLGKSVGGDF